MSVHSSRPGGWVAPVARRVEQRVVANAVGWFPELGATPRWRLLPLTTRPRCLLCIVALTGNGQSRAVVVKVRRGEPDGDITGCPQPARPRLRTTPASAAELTALEYEGLVSIRDTFGTQREFGSIRPLDHWPDESAVVMEHVDLPTLREGFVAESAGRTLRRSRRHLVPPLTAWRNAGSWLRAYHAAPEDDSKPTRQAHRADVVERFSAYGDFVSRRLGGGRGRAIGYEIAAAGASLAETSLPERLPLRVGHGDFVARNLFVDRTGRVTVFDPMPRWRVPPLEDVCRFVVGMRLAGHQVHSHGTAYRRDDLERREQLFLSGYFGDGDVPYKQLRCYQLLIVLDRWSALVESADRGEPWRAAARRAVMRPANAYIAREARRLVALAQRG